LVRNAGRSEIFTRNGAKTGQFYRCLPRGNEAMGITIYSVMTREEFIEVLDEIGYTYEIEGGKIIVTDTDKGNVWLSNIKSIPPNVVFRNRFDVWLCALTSLPSGVKFENGGDVLLRALTSLPPGVEFKNRRGVDLRSLTSISPGVEFNNEGYVSLDFLTGGRFNERIGRFNEREGSKIKGIDSKRLLNVMIKQGIFER